MGGDALDPLARLLERAREACRHGVAIELADQRVSFWSDLKHGARIAHTIFGPYCTVRDIAPADRGRTDRWRVASAKISSFATVKDRLVDELTAGVGSAVPVRRWAGDVPADRYDLGLGRYVVVHQRPFAGLTVFLRDERELFYLRSDAAHDVPHTEHVVKYPLRVALRQAGFSQVHAAACSFRGRGLLLMGPRRSGKSTLLMQLMNRGARFVASDFSFLHRIRGERGGMIAFPHMIRVALGTIGDNDRVRESLARHERTNDYLRAPVFNAGKEEFYFPVLERIWGRDAICRVAPLDMILFPALDLSRTHSDSARLSRNETRRRIRDTLMNDPPTLDWLPFMSDAAFESLLRASAEDVLRCAPVGYELRFGPHPTDPVAVVEELLGTHPPSEPGHEGEIGRAARAPTPGPRARPCKASSARSMPPC